MKQFFKRLFCLHLNWRKPLDGKKFANILETEWECISCGKRAIRRNDNPPLQWIDGTESISDRDRERILSQGEW